MTKKVIKACDICGEEYSYEIKPVEVIPAWMVPGWWKKVDHFSKVQLYVYNGDIRCITGYSECCPECTKVLRVTFEDAIKFLKKEQK